MAEAKTKTAQKAAAPKKTAAAKPAAKKAVATAALADAPAKTATKAAAKPAAKGATSKKAPAATWNPGNEERYNMIQVAAYYLAERDNFAGSPVDYWIAAEAQVSSMLPKK